MELHDQAETPADNVAVAVERVLSWQIELHAVPQEQDEEGNFVDQEPYWMKLEELTRDDIIPTEVWDVLLDAVDDKCRTEDAERRRIAAARAASPTRPSPQAALRQDRFALCQVAPSPT